MRVEKSDKLFTASSDPGKAAVISRFNQFVAENSGHPLDWGGLIAELMEAYVSAESVRDAHDRIMKSYSDDDFHVS